MKTLPLAKSGLAIVALALTHSTFALSLTPVADTYVNTTTGGASGTTDNSAATQLLVKNQFGAGNANNRVTFLRFDGSGIIGGGISGAALDFTINSFSGPVNMTLQLFGVSNGAANESFDATTITYGNSGYTDGSADNNVNDPLFEGAGPLLTYSLSSSASVGSHVIFSGTALDDFLNANNNSAITFVLTTSTQNSSVFLGFASSENTTYAGPTLSVTAVPEPSSTALFAIAGFMILGLRRRLI